jgi:hypothetical protein
MTQILSQTSACQTLDGVISFKGFDKSVAQIWRTKATKAIATWKMSIKFTT